MPYEPMSWKEKLGHFWRIRTGRDVSGTSRAAICGDDYWTFLCHHCDGRARRAAKPPLWDWEDLIQVALKNHLDSVIPTWARLHSKGGSEAYYQSYSCDAADKAMLKPLQREGNREGITGGPHVSLDVVRQVSAGRRSPEESASDARLRSDIENCIERLGDEREREFMKELLRLWRSLGEPPTNDELASARSLTRGSAKNAKSGAFRNLRPCLSAWIDGREDNPMTDRESEVEQLLRRSVGAHLSEEEIWEHEYLDEEAPRRALADIHLARCVPCRERLEAWLRTADGTGDITPLDSLFPNPFLKRAAGVPLGRGEFLKAADEDWEYLRFGPATYGGYPTPDDVLKVRGFRDPASGELVVTVAITSKGAPKATARIELELVSDDNTVLDTAELPVRRTGEFRTLRGTLRLPHDNLPRDVRTIRPPRPASLEPTDAVSSGGLAPDDAHQELCTGSGDLFEVLADAVQGRGGKVVEVEWWWSRRIDAACCQEPELGWRKEAAQRLFLQAREAVANPAHREVTGASSLRSLDERDCQSLLWGVDRAEGDAVLVPIVYAQGTGADVAWLELDLVRGPAGAIHDPRDAILSKPNQEFAQSMNDAFNAAVNLASEEGPDLVAHWSGRWRLRTLSGGCHLDVPSGRSASAAAFRAWFHMLKSRAVPTYGADRHHGDEGLVVLGAVSKDGTELVGVQGVGEKVRAVVKALHGQARLAGGDRPAEPGRLVCSRIVVMTRENQAEAQAALQEALAEYPLKDAPDIYIPDDAEAPGG